MAPPNSSVHTEQTSLLASQNDINVNDSSYIPIEKSRRAYIVIFLGSIFISIRSTIIHAALTQAHLPLFLPIFVSSAWFFGLSSVGTISFNLDLRIKETIQDKKARTLVLFRILMAMIVIPTNYVALECLDVGTALTLLSTSPAIASVLSMLFLNDEISFTDILVLVVNFTGVYLVASENGGETKIGLVGVLAALLGAFTTATSVTVVKAMGTRVNIIQNLFSICTGGLLLSLLMFTFNFQSIYSLYNSFYYVLIIMGTESLSYVAQVCNNYAIKFCRPGIALVVRSANVPISFILGYIFLSEQPKFIEGIGVTLVLSSIAYIGCSHIR